MARRDGDVLSGSDPLNEAAATWRERLRAASPFGEVEICAATKTVPPEAVNRLIGAGICTIGENRVQELTSKLPDLDPGFRIHMIGQLQRNKVKYIAREVDTIQSVDRIELAEEIALRARQANRTIGVFIQVNVAGEARKAGAPVEGLFPLVQAAARFEGIRVRGLMVMAPLSDDPEAARPVFRRARSLFEELRDSAIEGVEMETLSMGMSGDCLVAAREGATMVRLGSALFGARAR